MNDKDHIEVEDDVDVDPPFDEDQDYDDGDDFETYGEKDKVITLKDAPFMTVVTEKESLWNEKGVLTKQGVKLFAKHQYVVFHNTEYGCTGNAGLFHASAFGGKYAPWSSAACTLKRSIGGCGSSEVSSMAVFFSMPVKAQRTWMHFLLRHVMIEPGPKLVIGVSTTPHREGADMLGLTQLTTWQSPHDQWDPRELGMYAWTHKALGAALSEYVGQDDKFEKFLYVPGNWSWNAPIDEWNGAKYMELYLGKHRPRVLKADIDNIPYLNHLVVK